MELAVRLVNGQQAGEVSLGKFFEEIQIRDWSTVRYEIIVSIDFIFNSLIMPASVGASDNDFLASTS